MPAFIMELSEQKNKATKKPAKISDMYFSEVLP